MRLHALEAFVDGELAVTPGAPELPGGWRSAFERDFHVAPQVAFLTREGVPHKLDYIGGYVDDELRLRTELSFLGLINESSMAALPLVHGKMSKVILASRRVQVDELRRPDDRLAARVQRKVCRLMIADYCCLGYPFPPACLDFAAMC